MDLITDFLNSYFFVEEEMEGQVLAKNEPSHSVASKTIAMKNVSDLPPANVPKRC